MLYKKRIEALEENIRQLSIRLECAETLYRIPDVFLSEDQGNYFISEGPTVRDMITAILSYLKVNYVKVRQPATVIELRPIEDEKKKE